MGQYFTPVIKHEDGTIVSFYSHNYDDGLKLMEHAYFCDGMVGAVLQELKKGKGEVFWIGDYADKDAPELSSLTRDQINEVQRDYGKYTSESKNCSCEEFAGWYIVNHTKQLYLKLPTVKGAIFDLALLTASGNGNGGGDYYGDYSEECGTWCGDMFELTNKKPDKDFTRVVYGFEEIS